MIIGKLKFKICAQAEAKIAGAGAAVGIGIVSIIPDGAITLRDSRAGASAQCDRCPVIGYGAC